jgi:hypothetical protein
LLTTVVFEESLEKRPLVRREEEEEEDEKTQLIILYIYTFNLKTTFPKGVLNTERVRENKRIK